MSRSYVSVIAPVIAVVATIGLAYSTGLGPFHKDPVAGAPADSGADGPDLEDPPPVNKPLPPAVNGVHTLFDDTWLVEEGQWTLGDPPLQDDEPSGTPEPSFTALLESVGPEGVYVTTPGFYGNYRTVVELHDQAPAVPAWCEDAAEASLRIGGERPAFAMGSFETFSDPVDVPAGTYRVRYCTEEQDRAATQDEFTGDEYTVYAGRHLLQLWLAPRRPDQVLREGSRWARQLHDKAPESIEDSGASETS